MMQASLYRALRAYWPGGPETRRFRKELERTEWYSGEELVAWQLDRLRSLVRYAYFHVPYYHQLYHRLEKLAGLLAVFHTRPLPEQPVSPQPALRYLAKLRRQLDKKGIARRRGDARSEG